MFRFFLSLTTHDLKGNNTAYNSATDWLLYLPNLNLNLISPKPLFLWWWKLGTVSSCQFHCLCLPAVWRLFTFLHPARPLLTQFSLFKCLWVFKSNLHFNHRYVFQSIDFFFFWFNSFNIFSWFLSPPQVFSIVMFLFQALNFNSSLQAVCLGETHGWFIFYTLLCKYGTRFRCFPTWVAACWARIRLLTSFSLRTLRTVTIAPSLSMLRTVKTAGHGGSHL